MVEALWHLRLLKKAPPLATFLFKQDPAGTEFFQKPISPPDFQIGSQIIDLMEPRRRTLACKLQVLHMIIHPRNFGLEQSFESFFRHQYTSRVFSNFIKQKIELAGHAACLPMIRLFETESKMTRANSASQMHRKTGTPIKNISAPLKILNLMSDCHNKLAVWS
ncbi:hypothetical protein MKS82_06770 [Ochrobactrum sp. A-1]|nr:hypothetical protein [Ochrobactrum sp. A-1]